MIWVSPSRWLKCMPQDRHVWCISSNPSEAKKLKLSSCWLLHSIHRHPHIIWNFLVVNRNIKLESPHINPCPNCAAWILIISEIAWNIGYKVGYNARTTTTTLLLTVKKSICSLIFCSSFSFGDNTFFIPMILHSITGAFHEFLFYVTFCISGFARRYRWEGDYHVRRKPFIRNNLHKVEHGMIQYSAIIPCVIKKESYCSITFRSTFAR